MLHPMPKSAISKREVTAKVVANLKTMRQLRGLSQARLSELLRQAGHHLAEPAIVNIETGRRRVDVEDLAAFCEVLDCPVEWMLTGTTPPALNYYPQRIVPPYIEYQYPAYWQNPVISDTSGKVA